jgi:hypothetical protein
VCHISTFSHQNTHWLCVRPGSMVIVICSGESGATSSVVDVVQRALVTSGMGNGGDAGGGRDVDWSTAEFYRTFLPLCRPADSDSLTTIEMMMLEMMMLVVSGVAKSDAAIQRDRNWGRRAARHARALLRTCIKYRMLEDITLRTSLRGRNLIGSDNSDAPPLRTRLDPGSRVTWRSCLNYRLTDTSCHCATVKRRGTLFNSSRMYPFVNPGALHTGPVFDKVFGGQFVVALLGFPSSIMTMLTSNL